MSAVSEYEGVVLSPTQTNEVIEDKLVHLKPVLEGVLLNLKALRDSWKIKDHTWKDLWDSAKDRTELS